MKAHAATLPLATARLKNALAEITNTSGLFDQERV
jgi:hypothetical protein